MSRKYHEDYEEKQFSCAAQAEAVKAACVAKVKRSIIAIGLALVASLIVMIGMNKENFPVYFGIGFSISIVAYILTGSFGKIMDSAFKLGKAGWLILPFPIDIITGMATIMAMIFIFLFFPTIFIIVSFFKNKKELREAEKYLEYLR